MTQTNIFDEQQDVAAELFLAKFSPNVGLKYLILIIFFTHFLMHLPTLELAIFVWRDNSLMLSSEH